MKEAEMAKIGSIIAAIIREPESEEVKQRVMNDVAEITEAFPMYPNRLRQPASGAITAA